VRVGSGWKSLGLCPIVGFDFSSIEPLSLAWHVNCNILGYNWQDVSVNTV
jgi:hypothetical protein